MTERRFAILVALAAASVGCSHADGVKVVAGRRFPIESVSKVEPGMTEDQVRATLGDPIEMRLAEAGTSWRYFYEVQQRSTTSLCGIVISTTAGQTWERETLVSFVTGPWHQYGAGERLEAPRRNWNGWRYETWQLR